MISFWHDGWLGMDTIASNYPLLFRLTSNKKRAVNELSNEELGSWNSRLRRNLKDTEIAECGTLIHLSSLVSLTDRRDRRCWKLEQNRIFSASSLLNDINSHIHQSDCHYMISYGKNTFLKGSRFFYGSFLTKLLTLVTIFNENYPAWLYLRSGAPCVSFN